jgi:hypothetical protein
VWLFCERQFKRVNGLPELVKVIATIEADYAPQPVPTKKTT